MSNTTNLFNNIQLEDKHMLDTYQVLSLLFLFGGFLIALLTYIDKHNKR